MSAGLRTILGAWWMRLQSAPVPDAAGCVVCYDALVGTATVYDAATGSATVYDGLTGTATAYDQACTG